jgi:hypothetical protein
MGIYYYTYRKSVKNKKAQFNGQEIQVGFADFATSHGYIRCELSPQGQRQLTRAQNIPKDEQADYIVFGGVDGHTVYKNNKLGAWCDTPMWSGIKQEDEIGKLFKIKGKYHIVPKGVSVRKFMETNFPKLYFKPLPHTQVYVGIHSGYTATVREIRQLEDFVFGFGKNDVDKYKFHKKQIGQDVPEWFVACVDEVIEEKRRQMEEVINETV